MRLQILSNNNSIKNSAIGCIRGHYSCFWRNKVLINPLNSHACDELNAVIKYLETDIAPTYNALYDYCKSIRKGITEYFFSLEGELFDYVCKFVTLRGDYNLYVYQYPKSGSKHKQEVN